MRRAPWSTGTRLLLGLGLPLLLLAGYAWLATVQLHNIEQSAERMSATERAQAEASCWPPPNRCLPSSWT